MALVVLLRGINVGGYRNFRPSILALKLKHLDIVNIGAAGTFVIRRRVGHAQLRHEFSRRLPFPARITICEGREILELMSRDYFADDIDRPGIVRFVSVMSQRPRSVPSTPVNFPATGKWLLRVLATENRFIVGLYRRHMKVIGYLGKLDEVFGVPVTTRNWNTLGAIAGALK